MTGPWEGTVILSVCSNGPSGTCSMESSARQWKILQKSSVFIVVLSLPVLRRLLMDGK